MARRFNAIAWFTCFVCLCWRSFGKNAELFFSQNNFHVRTSPSPTIFHTWFHKPFPYFTYDSDLRHRVSCFTQTCLAQRSRTYVLAAGCRQQTASGSTKRTPRILVKTSIKTTPNLVCCWMPPFPESCSL
ncbi:hypothetical protein DFH11DRAFT_1126944 [Phellopilus nigrolimitatus]|nr:hypothetical protein DFH11DRAFT_1126944 [Phellopilus nigrolimitatus]